MMQNDPRFSPSHVWPPKSAGKRQEVASRSGPAQVARSRNWRVQRLEPVDQSSFVRWRVGRQGWPRGKRGVMAFRRCNYQFIDDFTRYDINMNFIPWYSMFVWSMVWVVWAGSTPFNGKRCVTWCVRLGVASKMPNCFGIGVRPVDELILLGHVSFGEFLLLRVSNILYTLRIFKIL